MLRYCAILMDNGNAASVAKWYLFWFTRPFGRIPTARVNKRNTITTSHHRNPTRQKLQSINALFFLCNNAHRILLVVVEWARTRSTADFRVFFPRWLTDWFLADRRQLLWAVSCSSWLEGWIFSAVTKQTTPGGHRKCLKAWEECAPPPVSAAECEEPTLTGQTALEWKTLDWRGSHWFSVNSITWFRLRQGWFLQLHHFNGLYFYHPFTVTVFTTNNKYIQTFIV